PVAYDLTEPLTHSLYQPLLDGVREPIANDSHHAIRVGSRARLLRDTGLNRFAYALTTGLPNVLADGLAQLLACRRDDALADFGIDAVAYPRGELLGVVPTEVLREWSLGQGLVYR